MVDGRKRRHAVTAALVLAAGLNTVVAAQARADGGDLALDLGYDGKLFIKVLDIRFKETITASRHAADARLVSYGILSAFKKVDLHATTSGTMVHGEPHPGTFMHVNLDGKRNRRVDVAWTGGKVAVSAVPTYGKWGDPLPTEAQKLAAADPLTQLTRLMLNSTAQGPCRGTRRFFNGRELYDLGFSDPQATAISKSDQKLGLVNGLRCNAVYREVAGFDKKKAKDANQGINRPIILEFAQVGQDGPWIITRLRAHTPLGPAVIDLVSVKATGGGAGN